MAFAPQVSNFNQPAKRSVYYAPKAYVALRGCRPGLIAATPAVADTLKSGVAFNNSIGKKTASQPANGVEVAYPITLKGGDLDGCAVDVVEQLYGREDGAWGIFDIAGDVKCDRGGFSYTSSGRLGRQRLPRRRRHRGRQRQRRVRGHLRSRGPAQAAAAPMPATAPSTSPTTWCSTPPKTEPTGLKRDPSGKAAPTGSTGKYEGICRRAHRHAPPSPA